MKARTHKEILKYYLDHPTEKIQDIANHFLINKSTVSTVINHYYQNLMVHKELAFCYSFSCPTSIGYLFDDIQERKVLFGAGYIANREDFTQYELDWLLKNYNLENTYKY